MRKIGTLDKDFDLPPSIVPVGAPMPCTAGFSPLIRTTQIATYSVAGVDCNQFPRLKLPRVSRASMVGSMLRHARLVDVVLRTTTKTPGHLASHAQQAVSHPRLPCPVRGVAALATSNPR